MATLTGTTIQSTYDSLLKVTDNDSITGSLKRITDGLGNNTPLYLSSSAVEIVSALNVIGNITATNLSGTNTGDETKGSIESKLGAATSSNSGYLTSTDWSTFNNKIAGSGTLNKLAKFSSSSSIADSTITDTGSAVTIGVATTVSGNLTASALIKSGGTASQILAADGSVITAGTNITISGGTISSSGGISGSGTTNTIPKFTGSTAIGNSNITDTGSLITLTGNTTISSGSLGIGTTTLTEYSLRLSKTITGATVSYGVQSQGVIQSDVTSIGAYYSTLGGTQATTFTLDNLMHFRAAQGTFGAGSTVTNQYGVRIDSNLIGATNNFGLWSNIPSGTNRWNLFMNGTADNFILGNVGIGGTSGTLSTGPILTTTLTNGGSGYVDGTYTDVASTQITGTGAYSLFTVVVSGGIVTSATLTWGGISYRAGDTITISNTLLGGTGSGLIITVATAESPQLRVTNANGADMSLYRSDTSMIAGDNIGSIKFENNDSSTKASGIQAKITAFGAAAAGGSYLSFFTRAIPAGSSLVEGMRVTPEGNVLVPTGSIGIGSTSLTSINLRISKSLTASTSPIGLLLDGAVQSDVTNTAAYVRVTSSTAAASYTTGNINYFAAVQGTFGAGSTVTNQNGFLVSASLVGAQNNFAFRSQIPAGTNRWNLYMDGTANNYLAGNLGIGTTSPATNVDISGSHVASIGLLRLNSASGNISAQTYYINSVYKAAIFADTSNHFNIWGREADTIFSTGTTITERMRITSGGLVGIGTSSPDARLFVDSGSAGAVARFNSTNANGGYLTGYSSGTAVWDIGTSIQVFGSGTSTDFGLNTRSGFLGLGTANTERMRITSTGNVGIGTSSPNLAGATIGLSVNSSNYSVFELNQNNARAFYIYSNAGESYIGNFGAAPMIFRTTDTERMRITSAGNVGIGTSTADSRLHVLGTFRTVLTSGAGGQTLLSAISGVSNGYLINVDTSNNITHTWHTGANNPSMHITSGGSVGIGTSSPSSSVRLHVYDPSANGDIALFESATTKADIWLKDTGTSTGAVRLRSESNAMVMITGGSEKVRIFSGGNVAIGSSTDNNTGAKLQVTGGMTYQNLFNRRTASYTLTINDQNYIVEMNVGSANNLTIPPNSSVAFPVGTEIAIIQYGAGQTTIVAGSGVTLRSKSNALKISGRYAGCTLVKIGTDEWYVIGDLTL